MIFLHKIVYSVYRSFIVFVFQGGAGVPCPPFSVFLAPSVCLLHALPFVVGGGEQVYAGDWGVGGSGSGV